MTKKVLCFDKVILAYGLFWTILQKTQKTSNSSYPGCQKMGKKAWISPYIICVKFGSFLFTYIVLLYQYPMHNLTSPFKYLYLGYLPYRHCTCPPQRRSNLKTLLFYPEKEKPTLHLSYVGSTLLRNNHGRKRAHTSHWTKVKNLNIFGNAISIFCYEINFNFFMAFYFLVL